MNHHFNFHRELKLAATRAGLPRSSNYLRAESILLKKEFTPLLANRVQQVTNNPYFTRAVAGIILQSPVPVIGLEANDLLTSLAEGDQGIVLQQPHTAGDYVWTQSTPPNKWRDSFWPFPVTPSRLYVRKDGAHYHLSREEVLNWNRAVVKIGSSDIAAFQRYLRTPDSPVRAVVADNFGVVAILHVEADNYLSWRRGVRDHVRSLKRRRINHGTISMHTLVPISMKLRGRGSILYLAQ